MELIQICGLGNSTLLLKDIDKNVHFCCNLFTKMLKRLLFYKLAKYLKAKEALVITGMRQVGKTTLMRQIYDELGTTSKLWFDFDNPLDQKNFENVDYNAIYKKLKVISGSPNPVVFIDEIQNFPEITKIIKYLIDHYQIKFIVTGSSNYYMRNLFPESLSGRKFVFELSSMSFREYLYFNGVLELKDVLMSSDKGLHKATANSTIFNHKKYEPFYEDFLEFGGFPEVVVTNDPETKRLILVNIFKSFFEKDIKLLSDLSDIKELRDLLLLLVPRVGSMIDVSKISSELSIDRSKVYRFLEYLQAVFIIRLIPKFSSSIDRAVAGGKKVYFTDNGILEVIGKVNESQLFENALVNQLFFYGDVSFYNRRNTSEIDFIVDKSHAFEAKLKGTEGDFIKLNKLSGKLNITKFFVITKSFVEKKGFVSPTVI